MTAKSTIWYVAVAAALVAGLVYAFWPQPVPVDTAVLARGDLVVTIDGDGRTRVREVYVVSAPVPGRVMRIQRHVGDSVVARETILATIHPSDPAFLDRRARAQAESAAKAAEAGFALAEAELARAVADLDFAQAEIKKALKLEWDDELVALYGEMKPMNASAQLKQAESWLAGRPEDPVVLLD